MKGIRWIGPHPLTERDGSAGMDRIEHSLVKVNIAMAQRQRRAEELIQNVAMAAADVWQPS